ncbi:MAG TPA: hypothetical protein VN578_03445 [Candidatus Binatia bacterium]|nr:hypothetical protein [Candidatus Binatia bacterium]
MPGWFSATAWKQYVTAKEHRRKKKEVVGVVVAERRAGEQVASPKLRPIR